MTGAQASIQETTMSKGQRGNKEAKKPKKIPVPALPPASGTELPLAAAAAARREPGRGRK
jgi:hypothetical protein